MTSGLREKAASPVIPAFPVTRVLPVTLGHLVTRVRRGKTVRQVHLDVQDSRGFTGVILRDLQPISRIRADIIRGNKDLVLMLRGQAPSHIYT